MSGLVAHWPLVIPTFYGVEVVFALLVQPLDNTVLVRGRRAA